MWSFIKWLVWGNPEENNNLNTNLEIITRKSAVKKIEKAYLNYKQKESIKKIVNDNLDLVSTEFKEKTTLQSALYSRKVKKKRRKKNRRAKKRKREFLPIRL